MHVPPPLRLALALVLVAPAACTTAAQREQAQRLAPAHAPAGVFADGNWSGTITLEPRSVQWNPPSQQPFEVQVRAMRDSTYVAFVFAASGSPVSGAGGASPRVLPVGGGGRSWRAFPRDLRVAGDTMTFDLPRLGGWRDVSCRVVRGDAGTWDGGCHKEGEGRVAQLSLGIPLATPRGN